MEIDNMTVGSANGTPTVRLNAGRRNTLGVQVGDTVLVKKVTVETVEAEVHQARANAINDVVVAGDFEAEVTNEIVTLAEADTEVAEEEPEAEEEEATEEETAETPDDDFEEE